MVYKGGKLGFIMPKSLMYSKRWRSLKNHILRSLILVIDLSKAFKHVKLEEIILVSFAGTKTEFYSTQKGESKQININKSKLSPNTSLIVDLTEKEYRLYEKMNVKSVKLESYINAYRGLNVQKSAVLIGENQENCMFCIEGRQLKPFYLLPVRRIIKNSDYSEKIINFRHSVIFGQLANAHVKNPKPHFKLAFCRSPKSSKFIPFDTVINIGPIWRSDKKNLRHYLLCLLNSNIFAWYLYKIVYAGAIRSTRLDYEYLKQVPFIPPDMISEKIMILWYFLAVSSEYVAYGKHYASKSSQYHAEIEHRLKKIMNTGIFMLYLSKTQLDEAIESNIINWNELEVLSKNLDEILHKEISSMIIKQKTTFNQDCIQIIKKIDEYSKFLWDVAFQDLNTIAMRKVEWDIISIE